MEVAKTVVDALLPFKHGGVIKTITTDNGPEFANHEYITKNLELLFILQIHTLLGKKDVLKTLICYIGNIFPAILLSIIFRIKKY